MKEYAVHGVVARRWATTLVRNPREAWDRLRILSDGDRDGLRRPETSGTATRGLPSLPGDGLERLHEMLGWSWPCVHVEEFERYWAAFGEHMAGEGAAGRDHDGDPRLASSIWCVVRHTRPPVVVETGVARGVTSRTILEALTLNGPGTLTSVDLPPLRDPWHSQSCTAVPAHLRSRWRYVRGSARRVLPAVLQASGDVSLFVHDSLHTYDHMTFEFEVVLPHLTRGGLIVSDDVDSNPAFSDFIARHGLEGVVFRHARKSGEVGIAWRSANRHGPRTIP